MRRPAEPGSWDLLARLIAGEHWQSVAACRTAEPDLFFPVSASENNLPQVAEAKEICGRCMARGRCLEFAIETRQLYGIWGGRTEEERYPLIRDRKLTGLPADRPSSWQGARDSG